MKVRARDLRPPNNAVPQTAALSGGQLWADRKGAFLTSSVWCRQEPLSALPPNARRPFSALLIAGPSGRVRRRDARQVACLIETPQGNGELFWNGSVDHFALGDAQLASNPAFGSAVELDKVYVHPVYPRSSRGRR